MVIREMQISDYDRVDGLMQQLHQLHVEGRPDLYVDMEHPYSQEEYEKKVNHNEVISILAQEEESIIGICFAVMRNRSYMTAKRTAYMEDLVVAKEWRNKGVAKALFLEAEKRARAQGAERLDLMVWDFNKNAMEFYRAMGMKPQTHVLEKEL